MLHPDRRGRRLLGARALARRQGSEAARARASEDPGRRRVPHAPGSPRPRRRLRGHRHDRDDRRRRRSIRFPRSPTCVPPRACGSTSTRPMRARPRSARSSATTSPAGSGRTRSASTRTSGSACRWTARRSGRGGPTTSATRSASCPSSCASPDDAVNLSEVSIPLGRRFRALKLWAVLRCYGRSRLAGADPRARPARGALRGVGAGRAGLGGRRAAPLLARLLPARRVGRGERAAPRARQRLRRGLPLARAARRDAMCCGSRSATSARPRTTCGSPGTCSGARLRRSEVDARRAEDAPAVGRRDEPAAGEEPARVRSAASARSSSLGVAPVAARSRSEHGRSRSRLSRVAPSREAGRPDATDSRVPQRGRSDPHGAAWPARRVHDVGDRARHRALRCRRTSSDPIAARTSEPA